jgi:hypothetical protein
MKHVPLLLIFPVLLLAFFANPAPVSIEIADIGLLGLVLLTGLTGFSQIKTYTFGKTESFLLFALVWYLVSLLLSGLSGLLHGIPVLNVLRSIGPYLGFFPLLFAGFLQHEHIRPRKIAIFMLMAGLLQSGYLVYLYAIHAGHSGNTMDVLRNRITLKDPRTTLPLILAIAVLPLVFYFGHTRQGRQQWLLEILAGCLMLLGLFSGVITLTRAIVLAMLMGWATFFLLFFHYCTFHQPHTLPHMTRKTLAGCVLFIMILLSFSQVPAIHVMENGLLARFQNHHAGNKTDYSDGRLYDEWAPALTTWKNSGPAGILLGIGSGNSFTVLSGEERTYIHNLCIYNLVYGGIFGLAGCMIMYLALFRTLLKRTIQTGQTVYLAWAALLASLFFYGQLFAVHKGLAFNAMLFVIVAIALAQPEQSQRMPER